MSKRSNFIIHSWKEAHCRHEYGGGNTNFLHIACYREVLKMPQQIRYLLVAVVPTQLSDQTHTGTQKSALHFPDID